MKLMQKQVESSLFSVIILMAGISHLFVPFCIVSWLSRYIVTIVSIAQCASLDAARQDTGQLASGQGQIW